MNGKRFELLVEENKSENQIVWFPSTRFQLFTICVVCKLRATKII